MNLELKYYINNGGEKFSELIDIAQKEFRNSANNEIKKLTLESKYTLLIWWIEMLFSGGGVDAYLNDEISSHHEDFLTICKKIGALKTNALFDSLRQLFPDRNWENSLEKRRAVSSNLWENYTDNWSSYQSKFFEQIIHSNENIGGLYLIFLKSNYTWDT